MKEIVLTDEQAKVIAEADEPVELRDAAGTIVVKFDPMDAQALANHRRRKLAAIQGTGIPGSRVRQQHEALQSEWDRTGGFDGEDLEVVLA